jgi:hypothetical protein
MLHLTWPSQLRLPSTPSPGRVAELGSYATSHVMKNWTLILAISCLIVMMIGFPGCYDSKRRADAHRQYRDAPTEQTRTVLQDAKASDRRHILVFEVALGCVLAVLWWALVRTNKNTHESVA